MTDEKPQQMRLFPEPEKPPEPADVGAPRFKEEVDELAPRVIPLELERSPATVQPVPSEPIPSLPSRWEDVTIEAQNKDVLPVIVEKLRDVPAYRYLSKLIALSRDEGYVWVVHGKAGSGKSAFFQTLEYKFREPVKTLIINAKDDDHKLANHLEFSEYLHNKIAEHARQHGASVPLVVVLEGREQVIPPEERSSISQTLRNVLRAPGPGRNVVFVLPVTNLSQSHLFIEEVRETGVAISPEGVYSFIGPDFTEHAEIVSDLFFILNGKSIEEYGILRSELQSFASSQQTIGDYIRTIRAELWERHEAYQTIVNSYGYRPITVIVCFFSPEPAYVTQRVIKGMTVGSFGHINPGEIVRATRGQRARRWDDRGQVLAKIIHALDIRVVEFPPEIVTKLFYAYGWPDGGHTGRRKIGSALELIEQRLDKKGVRYKKPQSVRHNVRQQLSASNLFRIVAGEETRRLSGTRFGHLSLEKAPQSERKRRDRENANRIVGELACEIASNNQYELHTMVAQGLKDALKQYGSVYPRLAHWRDVSPESSLSFLDEYHRERKLVRPDIVIETQDRLYLLEFYWRNKLLSDAEIASYVLRKIEESYLALPMIKALENM